VSLEANVESSLTSLFLKGMLVAGNSDNKKIENNGK